MSETSSHSGVIDGRNFWSMPDLTGENYVAVLLRFHTMFKPKNYLEVGVFSGDTLQLAECPTIGVDPQFQIDRPFIKNKEVCHLYQMTSDAFFDTYSPTAIFGKPVELAFLDGMHWFEFLLRDFINTERHCKKNSVVFMHDCMPTDQHIGRRDASDRSLADISPHPGWCAGDVWKVIAILLEFRPDLRLLPFNASPTGLIAVTGFDPSSTVLSDHYFSIVERFQDSRLADYSASLASKLTIRETQHYASFGTLSSLFWL